jgi:hypothetical protein
MGNRCARAAGRQAGPEKKGDHGASQLTAAVIVVLGVLAGSLQVLASLLQLMHAR